VPDIGDLSSIPNKPPGPGLYCVDTVGLPIALQIHYLSLGYVQQKDMFSALEGNSHQQRGLERVCLLLKIYGFNHPHNAGNDAHVGSVAVFRRACETYPRQSFACVHLYSSQWKFYEQWRPANHLIPSERNDGQIRLRCCLVSSGESKVSSDVYYRLHTECWMNLTVEWTERDLDSDDEFY
jgi:hypothetical protein